MHTDTHLCIQTHSRTCMHANTQSKTNGHMMHAHNEIEHYVCVGNLGEFVCDLTRMYRPTNIDYIYIYTYIHIYINDTDSQTKSREQLFFCWQFLCLVARMYINRHVLRHACMNVRYNFTMGIHSELGFLLNGYACLFVLSLAFTQFCNEQVLQHDVFFFGIVHGPCRFHETCLHAWIDVQQLDWFLDAIFACLPDSKEIHDIVFFCDFFQFLLRIVIQRGRPAELLRQFADTNALLL